jgi:hypothetical protein
MKHKREVIKWDLEKSIVHLIRIFQDYAKMKGHNKLLAAVLFDLLENLVNNHREIDGDEAKIEDEDEEDDGMAFHSPAPGKKVLLH